jgi:hypothetical protein
MRTDDDVAVAIGASDFVLGCLDPGLVSITYKLNRACLKKRVRWTSATVSAFEAVVGPTVFPHETACFLCYQMRVVACADDPDVAVRPKFTSSYADPMFDDEASAITAQAWNVCGGLGNY